MTVLLTVLRHAAVLVAGLLAGLASVVVHRDAGGLGLLLVVATSTAIGAAVLGSPWPATGSSYAVGWLVVFVVAAGGRPEGDLLVAGDTAGLLLMGVALGHAVLLLVALALWRRRQT